MDCNYAKQIWKNPQHIYQGNPKVWIKKKHSSSPSSSYAEVDDEIIWAKRMTEVNSIKHSTLDLSKHKGMDSLENSVCFSYIHHDESENEYEEDCNWLGRRDQLCSRGNT